MPTKIAANAWIGVLLALALIAGCERGDQPQASQQTQGTQAGYQARLQAMPEQERNAVFIRAIRDAGFDCQHVADSAYQGPVSDAPTWVAGCDDGSRWMIMIGNDGTAQVVDNADVRAAASPAAANATR
jgi:hypothetical protein